MTATITPKLDLPEEILDALAALNYLMDAAWDDLPDEVKNVSAAALAGAMSLVYGPAPEDGERDEWDEGCEAVMEGRAERLVAEERRPRAVLH